MRLTKAIKAEILVNAIKASDIPKQTEALREEISKHLVSTLYRNYGGKSAYAAFCTNIKEAKERVAALASVGNIGYLHADGSLSPTDTYWDMPSVCLKFGFNYNGAVRNYHLARCVEKTDSDVKLYKFLTELLNCNNVFVSTPANIRLINHCIPKPLAKYQTRRVTRINAKLIKLATAYSDLCESIEGILNQCNTDKQLLAMWPEAEELLPKDQSSKQLPAIPISVSHINNLLKLPSDKVKTK